MKNSRVLTYSEMHTFAIIILYNLDAGGENNTKYNYHTWENCSVYIKIK